MKLTNAEALYIRRANDLFPKATEKTAKEKIAEFPTIPNNQRIHIAEATRNLSMLLYGLGLKEKADAEDGDLSKLRLVITSLEDIDTGMRHAVHSNILNGLSADGVRMIQVYNCDPSQHTAMNTYVLVVDAEPNSAIHEKLKDCIRKYNIEIRFTTEKMFSA